jgi:hypothetical protein
MLTNAASPTLLADSLAPVMLTDAAAPAILALALQPSMLANAATPAILALAPALLMEANAVPTSASRNSGNDLHSIACRGRARELEAARFSTIHGARIICKRKLTCKTLRYSDILNYG